jgi:hypothetical protein
LSYVGGNSETLANHSAPFDAEASLVEITNRLLSELAMPFGVVRVAVYFVQLAFTPVTVADAHTVPDVLSRPTVSGGDGPLLFA